MIRLYLRWTEKHLTMREVGNEHTGPVELEHNVRQAMESLFISSGITRRSGVDIESVQYSIEED